MSYVLEVNRLPVWLVELDGQRIEARFFLHTVSERRGGPETLEDRLNEPNTHFLPFEIQGEVALIHLHRLAYVEFAGRLPEVEEKERVGACRQAVELDLVFGETLSGELLYELPPGKSRVLDLLNTPAERFLLLVNEGLTRYVNREGLIRVRTR